MEKLFLKEEINNIIKSQMFINNDLKCIRDLNEKNIDKISNNIEVITKQLDEQIQKYIKKSTNDSIKEFQKCNSEIDLLKNNINIIEKLIVNENKDINNSIKKHKEEIINEVYTYHNQNLKSIKQIQNKQDELSKEIVSTSEKIRRYNDSIHNKIDNLFAQYQDKNTEMLSMIIKIKKAQTRRFWIILILIICILGNL